MFCIRNAGFAAALTVMCVVSAQAQIQYRVVNVPIGDTLSMRRAPDPHASKLWEIPRTASNLEALGRSVNVNGARWVMVEVAGRRGWVNARFVAAMLADAEPKAKERLATRAAEPRLGPLNVSLDCVGERPNWVLRADGQDFRLRDAEANTRIWAASGPLIGQRDGSWRVAGVAVAPRAVLSGSLRPSAACEASAGAADAHMAIRLSFDGKDLRGCCSVKPLKPDS